MTVQETELGRFISLILRHKPEIIGLSLDKNGWADVEEFISKLNQNGKQIDQKILENIVQNNNKKRFAFSPDRKSIRANQGHSVDIELGYQPQIPPFILYHGTCVKNIILK
jgi:putative RNA 2'-phosphotransferase